MSIGPSDLLILDTTILVHWVRQDRTGQYLKYTYTLDERPERPLFSTISEGEIVGLAKYWGWGEAKLTVSPRTSVLGRQYSSTLIDGPPTARYKRS